MKKQLELLLTFIACCLLFINCQKDDLESTQDLQQSKIIYRKIPFADLSSRSPKTINELEKVLEKSKTNDFGRGLSENNSYAIDSTSVVYIDNGEGYSSYTFSVLPAQNDTYLQNIIISNYSNGETKTFLAEYELNKTVEQIDDDNFISSIKKTEFYNLSNPNMVYGRGSMCVDLGYEDILNVCEGNLVTESQDPECFNSDGTPKTKVVFIIIASACSGSGGDGYGSPSHGDTSPGTSDGLGSGGGGIPNPNPDYPTTTTPEPNPNDPQEPVTEIGDVITSPTLPSPTGFKTFSAGLSVSQQQWLNLLANADVKNQVRNYLDQNGYSDENENFANEIINYCMENNTTDIYSLDKIKEVEDYLENNFEALLDIDCTQLPKWQTIAQHSPPQTVKDKIAFIDAQTGWFSSAGIQTLNDANNGAAVNMDFFPVTISQMPKKPNGVTYTQKELFDYIRLNINDFFDSLAFTPIENEEYNVHDSALWLSNNPIGAILRINIQNNNGSVVCSNYNSSTGEWIFTTITDPWSYSHPVSGNRAFGYYIDLNGNMVVYTRGVDRLTHGTYKYGSTGMLAEMGQQDYAFNAADAKWTNFQSKVRDFVNSGQSLSVNNGQATVNTPIKNRPIWSKVQQVLMGQRPVSDLGCP